jgi:hypothetical protein
VANLLAQPDSATRAAIATIRSVKIRRVKQLNSAMVSPLIIVNILKIRIS